MCIFHRWTKWEPYWEEGTACGGLLGPKTPTAYTQRRQKRHCEKCGEEQDKPVEES